MMDYKRAYQIVLKKVEDLEEENERLKERAHILCEAADNISQPDYVQHAIEMMREELAAIHPQSE